MWKSVLSGLVLENIETLKHYQTSRDDNKAVVDDISEFITNVITGLPWHFRLPIGILVYMIGLLCLIVTGRSLNSLSSIRRSTFLRYVRFIPFFGMLNDLIRSLTFMRLFDAIPVVSDYSHSVKVREV